MSTYIRYRIETRPAPPRAPHPSRFRVRIRRMRLAQLILGELFHYRADLPVVLSRPCVYGVFSGPIGGFAPRERLCVGCLRCTVQYPDIVQILPNPDRKDLGDSYFDPDRVDTVLYEAATGRVPVRGAGYRGPFAGPGWDSMWTDMSEIVRPTRDGIHGREFISTAVDLGERPGWLNFGQDGQPAGETPRSVTLPVPFLFDRPARSLLTPPLVATLVEAAATVQTRALVPYSLTHHATQGSRAVIPIVRPEDEGAFRGQHGGYDLIELEGWDRSAANAWRSRLAPALLMIRLPFGADLLEWVADGFRLFHLTADYHGRTAKGFVMDSIREAHDSLVRDGVREQVTLVGSGGVIAAEHLAKAIISGLDAVALDTPLWVALQGKLTGECTEEAGARVEMPALDARWAVQRLANLSAAWRDQLLEVLGAMGMRDVRRLRGEVGRAMLQADMEREAFAEIEGYDLGA
jgi:hypothetical protein